jgi:hypothetical protein
VKSSKFKPLERRALDQTYRGGVNFHNLLIDVRKSHDEITGFNRSVQALI